MTIVLATAARFFRRRRNAWVHAPVASSDSNNSSAWRTAGAAERSIVISAPLDPWIEYGVGDVDQQVRERDQDSVEEGHAHHHGVVAGSHALNEELPHAGKGEHVLDDERPGGKAR